MKNPFRSRFFRRGSQIFLALVLIAHLLVGCRFPWQDAQESTTKQVGEAEVVVETESPEITVPEPRQDLPPALVEVSPLPDSQIGLEQPILLYFNQPMDTASVEAAVHFEPSTSGRFSWEDEQVMTFVPDRALTAGSPLKLVVSTGAQAANKEALREPIEIDYQTAGLLEWVQAVPADGAVDVDPEGTVFLVFNQPVVALGVEAQGEPGFTLSPGTTGEGEWINTSTYLLRPDPSLDGGTTYTLQINQDLIAASGSSLNPAQEQKVLFTTTQPAVMEILPQAGDFLSLDGPVEMQFNIRMNPDSVAEHLLLMDSDGNRVAGQLEWDEGLKKVSFIPGTLLERDSLYVLQLMSGAESAGGLPIMDVAEQYLTTFPDFDVDPVSPPEFDSYYQSFGAYAIYFSTPVESENLHDKVVLSPEVSQPGVYLSEDGTRLNISGYFNPETQYTVTLGDAFQDIWGGGLEAAPPFTFVTPPADPSLAPVTGPTTNNLVFIPASESEITMQATNINQVNLELAPISIDDLVTLLHPDNYDYRQIFLPETLEKNIIELDLTRNTSELVRLPLSYQGEPLTPGVYFLGVASPELEDLGTYYANRLLLIVSDNNLVMKIAPEEALIWGTRLGDYSPLAEVPATLYSIEGEILAEGITDQEGLFEGQFSRSEDVYTNYYALLGEPGDENFAFSISNWMQFDSLYEQGIRLDTMPALTKAYFYTDRPLYRPGDTVHFKSILFSPINGAPIASQLKQVSVTVYGNPGVSGTEDILYSEEHALSDFGTLAGSFTLPKTASTGSYSIELSDGEEVIKYYYFNVAAYRKPEVELSVDLDREEIKAGEALTAKIQADYYFGLPAADLNFNWTLYEKEAYFNLPGYRVGPIGSDWLMPSPYGTLSPLGNALASGEGGTDLDGGASLSFSADDLALDDLMGSTTQVSLEVSLMDETGFPVSYRESVLVHPEDFYIGVRPEVYFGRAEAPINFAIYTVDWARQAVADLSLEAAFEGIEWRVEETKNPEMPYRYIPETTFISSASPFTDDEGRTRVSFTPPAAGTYRLSVRSGDAVTEVLIWVTGSGGAIWPRQIQNQIRLIPDADQYAPGETAVIFIPNPFPEGAKALVGVERGGVLSTQILDLEGPGTTFSLPITEEAIPNVYLSVILLGKTDDGRPDYRQGILNVPVSPASRTLDVSLVVDPSQSEPGSTVAATLTVRDDQGNPVQGEFSLAVVDKALLALVEPTSDPILEALYGEQALSVQTSISLKTYASQFALNPEALGLGGGGGAAELQTNLREDFPDTAFWQADILTGVDGTARVTIPMPDSLTTWMVDVRGLTEDYLVGQAEAEILIQKDLMIRPVTPRFLVDGDRVELGAVVHNNAGEALTVDVSLIGTGFSLIDKSLATQQVSVESGGRASVSWMGEVESVDTAELIFQAVSGAYTDASTPIWGDLEVRQYATPFTVSTSGELSEEGQRLELVSLPMSSDPSSGSLMLTLMPSLSATVMEGLEALETHPYSSTITVLSQLLANLHAYAALVEIGVDSPQLETNLLQLIDEEIGTLLDSQNFDGGWSWWRTATAYNATSDPFLTAYVLLGLEEAAGADLDVPQDFRDRAVEYMRSEMVEPGDIGTGCGLDQLSFQVYALRDADIYLFDYLQGLFARRSELSPWALGLLALAFNTKQGSLEQVRTTLDDLEGMAVRSATSVHWESERDSWLLPGTPIFNTAVSAFALAQLDPASASLAPAVQYLLNHRDSQGLWASPFDSAWCLIAVTKALQGMGDYQADFDFSASLNDIPFATGSVSEAAPQSSVSAVTPIEDLFPDAPNALMIERGPGAGTLYYRVDLETAMIPSEAEAVNRGISVQRDFYLAGEGCPGAAACTTIDSLTLDEDDPTQMITAAITITTTQDLYHFMLEDAVPSGTEILDPDLLTSPTVEEAFDFRAPFEHGWGWWYFNPAQTYDDHLLWTAEFLPAGTYTLTYQLLPTHRGIFQVLPARAWQFFYPEMQGSSAGAVFTIE